MELNLPYPLVLASASPRRRALMVEAGYEFSVAPPPLHEPAPPGAGLVTAVPWAEALAWFKARAVALSRPEAIIIGADTVVAYDDRIIGKARDEEHAREILTTMFAGRNEVITGLAVLCPPLHKRIITHETTTLDMRPMAPEEVEAYLAAGTWRGKAGAYAYQEGGDRFVRSLEGSPSNVVGLPMEKLEQVLAYFVK